MEQAFWLERWATGRIGFHEPAPHPLLTAHWRTLGLAPGTRVLVPLCGKSHDLAWLRAAGHEVIGVELAATALHAFAAEHGLDLAVRRCGANTILSGAGYTLIGGDFFALDAALLGPFEAIYDRAALIALMPDQRRRYVDKLCALSAAGTRGLLITVDYDTARLEPPPFVVGHAELDEIFGTAFALAHRTRVAAAVKGEPGFEDLYTFMRR